MTATEPLKSPRMHHLPDPIATSAFACSEGSWADGHFDPSKDPEHLPGQIYKPSGYCYDPAVLPTSPQLSLGSSGPASSLNAFATDLRAVESGPDLLEQTGTGYSLYEGHNLGDLEGMDLAFGSDTLAPRGPDLEASSSDPYCQSEKVLKATITLDDVEPSTLSTIMGMLIHSKAKVKFETEGTE